MAATQRKQVFFLTTACMAFMVAGAAMARAGFEFKGAPAAPAAASSAAPAATGGIQWDAGPGMMPVQKVQGIEAIPLTPGERKQMPMAMAGNPMSAPPRAVTSGGDIVSGFGSDLPLSVAIPQIVPPQYSITYGRGVKDDARVSWSGDRPWREVLADMLAKSGLSYTLQGNSINIKRSKGRPPDASDMAAYAPAPAAKMDMIPDDMMAAVGTKKTAPVYAEPTMAPQPMAPVPMAPVAAMPAPAPSKAVSMTAPRVTSAPERPAPARMMAEDTGMTPVPSDVYSTSAPGALEAAAAATAPTVMAPSWHALKGQTLRATLEDWSRAAHANLYWSTDYDYRLNDNIAFSGNYDEAVGQLLERFSMVKPQPYGRLHRNPAGESVLIVNTYNTIN